MSHPPDLSTPEKLAALCRGLEPAHQASLLDFARFLESQEAQASLEVVDEADEAEWERQFNDPAKTANFARWADESRAGDTSQPIDPARL